MSEYVNKEFSRILSNPGNEIISDSLRDKLRPIESSIVFSLDFGEDDSFECDLDSYSSDRESFSISLKVPHDVVRGILSNAEFSIINEDLEIKLSNSEVSSLSCFKGDSDIYILDLIVNSGDLLND